ncbi:glutaredoxin domain-containing protein [Rhodococcus sp. JVH1]|uniref:glutaredoxin domain-containing protein n=1 Tax=Rhodococcus sp. JVH1 TaxID=745408 RepID=UPI00027207EA|nr:glutaredoxin domain-containing protein [Rhodococcus sp. JVH1]EJJ01015.1 nrdH-redoxin [Rhodococcus sp. JVH1]
MTITVYTSPGCFPCKATKRDLDKAGIDYTLVDLSEDTEAAADMKKLGHLTAPVVIARLDSGTEHWSGHRPDRIQWLANELAALGYLAQDAAEGRP